MVVIKYLIYIYIPIMRAPILCIITYKQFIKDEDFVELLYANI